MFEFVVRDVYGSSSTISIYSDDPYSVVEAVLNHSSVKLLNKRLRLELDYNFFNKNNYHNFYGRDVAQEIALIVSRALQYYESYGDGSTWEDFRRLFLKESFKEDKRAYFENLVYNDSLLPTKEDYLTFMNSIRDEFKRLNMESLFDVFLQSWQIEFIRFLERQDESSVLDIVDENMWVEMIYIHNAKTFNVEGLEFRTDSPSCTSLKPNASSKRLFSMVNLGTQEIIDFSEEFLFCDLTGSIEKSQEWSRYKYVYDYRYDKLCNVMDMVQLLDRSERGCKPVYFGSYKLTEILSLKPREEFFLASGFIGLLGENIDYMAYIGLEHDLKCIASLEDGYFMPVILNGGDLAHTDALYDLIGRTDTIHAEIKSIKGVGKDGDGRNKEDTRRPVFAAVDI